MRLGFVGLGVMGKPMAGHLLAGGHDLTVWSRSTGKADSLVARGARQADSVEQLASQVDILFLCVNRTEDVQELCDKAAPYLNQGSLIVDHSTISPVACISLAADLNKAGFAFLDAPITGGSMGAQAGTLTIFCGGSKPFYEKALPYLNCYGKKVEHVGESGKGQMMKMANQIAVVGSLAGLCEAMAFADRAGLDLTTTRDLLSSGAAGSWAFENYGPKIIARDWTPGFSIKNQRKDLAYCIEAAQELSIDLSLTQLVDEQLAKLTSEGREEETTAALFDTY